MIDQLIEKIVQNPLFLKLKDIVENNAYHDYEDVYSHLIKTKDIAQREISGAFITNRGAKDKFLQFINEDFHGIKRSDIMILIALLHDIGKILNILVTDSHGITFFPGHEYEGSKIVREFVGKLNLPEEVIDYISNVVKNHDTFNQFYMEGRKDWPQDILISDMKSRADGLYLEAMFNIYCDCFTAAPFKFAKEMIIKTFNDPSFYTQNEYFIP